MSFVATSAASLIQAAAFTTLNVASFATDLLDERLYTDVPQASDVIADTGAQFPSAWLTFADPMEEPLDTFGRGGSIVHLELHVYSKYEGDDECIDILSKAYELLHHSNLTVSGWEVPFVHRLQGSLSIEDYNGEVLRHGIARVDVHARSTT